MSRALCTQATGAFTELLDISRPRMERYAQRHGWDLHVVAEDTAQGRPAAWGKVRIVRDLLDRYDVVAWLDADTVIVDLERDLAGELRRGKDLYLVEHHNGPSGEVTANTGVFMLRSGRWARRLLDQVWERRDLIDHRWWENAAIMELLGYRIDPQPATHDRRTRWLRRTRFLDVAWNSLPHWDASREPVIKHYAGLPLHQRAEAMRADVATTSAALPEHSRLT
jgi:hypothetical protein